MKRGVTLVEVLLACAVAAIGISFCLTLAADVISSSAKVRKRNAENVSARVALYRLRGDIGSSSNFSTLEGGLALTQTAGGVRWQVSTFDGTSYLTRVKSGQTPGLKDAVAPQVSQISLITSPAARTLAITAGAGGKRVKLTEVIRTWGVTL